MDIRNCMENKEMKLVAWPLSICACYRDLISRYCLMILQTSYCSLPT
jgi:hypothetical protein